MEFNKLQVKRPENQGIGPTNPGSKTSNLTTAAQAPNAQWY